VQAPSVLNIMPRVKIGPAQPDRKTIDVEIARLRDLDVLRFGHVGTRCLGGGPPLTCHVIFCFAFWFTSSLPKKGERFARLSRRSARSRRARWSRLVGSIPTISPRLTSCFIGWNASGPIRSSIKCKTVTLIDLCPEPGAVKRIDLERVMPVAARNGFA